MKLDSLRLQRLCSPRLWVTVVGLAATLLCTARAQIGTTLRPPSVPLVACDPYFSIWSPADQLYGSDTVHWTGKPHRLAGLLRVDGKVFRVMGREPADLPTATQTARQVGPTSTMYVFEAGGVELTLSFTTPALPENLELLSSPFTYLLCGVKSHDGANHEVALYFDAAAEIAVNQPGQEVVWSRESINNVQHPRRGAKALFKLRPEAKAKDQNRFDKIEELAVLKIGSKEQPVLQKRGDDLRIDWGYFYVAAPAAPTTHQVVASAESCRKAFLEQGSLPEQMDPRQPRAANDNRPVAATVYDCGKVGSSGMKPRVLILAYDDEYAIQYFKQNLRAYWRRHGWQAADLLRAAAHDYGRIFDRCLEFDGQLMNDLQRAGGQKYAEICALAYRQCYAANKIVADANGQPLMFPKENFSNGCIGTVDIIYPMAPQFLLLSPSLTKAMLVPILDYAASPRWRWPFAPHDLGTYPHANGQVYGGGERTEEDQMPVEETGNMILVLAALAQVEGNADFCIKYWPVLIKWAEYLKTKGFDPEKQLCTDDFAGHLAHNVNLSAKAICGLGAFAKLCEQRGDKPRAQELMALAKEFAARWVKEANDGDHYRLAFDRPGTWSQKYNLVWDRILGLNLFPDSVLRKEMDFYKTKQDEFGLPLDNRKAYTKLDWTLWTATLTQNRADFDALLDRVYRFLNESPSRVPMTDWYQTKTAKQEGFQARSVVGGVFLQMLYDQAAWKKWAGSDTAKAARWAPLPKAVKPLVVVPTSEVQGVEWRYTTAKPAGDWYQPTFDASSWQAAPGGFGSQGTPSAVIRTAWKTEDVWLRRDILLPKRKWHRLQLRLHHDEDTEVYLNGVLAAKVPGYSTDYESVSITPEAMKTLKPGPNVIAVHCHQTSGGQYIDVGLVDDSSQK
jgi:hypothetical protein